MKESQKIYLNAVNCIPGISYYTLKRIEKYFNGDFKAGFEASEGKLRLAGIDQPELTAVLTHRGKIDPEKEYKKMEKEKVRMIVFDEKEYPRLLKEIHLAPLFFYLKGDLKPEDEFCFGVVGTRLATDYGKETAYTITYKLAQVGLTIVSGLAYGIDTQAHKAALDARGRTIAVLGSGLDDKTIFPQENVKLAHKIIENGALISEYPLGMQASKEKFPFRNRIISGLARGVLIVEAPLKSGALITAEFALKQNRDVFAVPGNIFSKMSYGTNLLIKQGAALVARVEDILNELNLKYEFIAAPREIKLENEIEKKIFDVLQKSGEPNHIDEIIRNTGLGIQNVNATLTVMEMKGIIKNLGSGQFVLEEKYL